jgi:hypothetical protein
MTINEMTTRTGNLPATFGDDPYLDYGIEAATAGANFLNFDPRGGNGFFYGQDATPLPLGTRLAANMAGVRVGWMRWVDKKADKAMSLLSERRKITRDDLDAEIPDAPWKEAVQIEFVDTQGQQYIFSKDSVGAVKGVKKLCYDFARERRSRPGQIPVVELQQHWYPHPKFNKVWEPDFPIVDWVDETTLAPVGNGEDGAAEAPVDHLTPTEVPPFLEEEKPVETKASKPVPVLKAKSPRF